MSGRGEVRVLCQDREEPPPESPRMPAWKREILERRRAKGGAGCGGTGTAQEGSPGSSGAGGGGGGGASGAHRHNGSATVVNGTKQDGGGGGGGGGNGRNYTITTASQHFGNNKEARHTAAERATSRGEDGEESLVLQESLGPLEENPFIKLEKERRRRQDRENATRPVQHILELYGSVPGIRTIRAENIIIIESDPEYFPDGGVSGSGASKWQQNGVSTYSSLNDLLDRRGSAVTEIRAKEVVIYDTTISKSEENLSTLGRSDHELQAYDAQGEGQGRVSRMLQKFDSNYGKLQKKSHSTENLLDLDCSGASGRPRLWSPKPDAVPKPRFEPPTPVSQSPPEAFKPKAEPESPQQTPAHPVYSFRQRFGDAGSPPKDETDCRPPKPTREREWDSAADPKPKVPCSPDTRRARASESSPSSNKVLRSTPEFEIRPSPKPDLAGIPDSDPQARALANLRLQSKNSFMVIPKRRLATVDCGPVKSSPSHRAVPTSPTTARANDYLKTTPVKTTVKSTSGELSKTPQKVRPTETSPVFTKRPMSPTKSPSSSPTKSPSSSPTKFPSSSPTKAPSSPTKAPSSPTKAPSSPTKAPSSPTKAPSSPTKPVAKPVIVPAPFFETPDSHSASPAPAVAPAPSPPSSPLGPLSPPPAADHHLPVTNIDDVEVEPPQRVPAPSPLVHRRKGNTFTVVPKRRPETDSPQQPPELQPEVGAEGAPPAPPQAPYSQLGTLLKKRYPAVEEIEVIGGYLSLEKSCLIKTGSTGKKLKISFNEASLQSTYEYPSETSAWDSDEEEDEDGRKDSPEEQPSMVGRIHIPRAGLAGSPLHPNNANDLSNYIPKHSVDYNTWQEQRIQESAVREETPQPTLVSEEVMLTPADSSSLSDFSSEPALYF